MDVTGCDEHVDALAERVNGEATVAPPSGALTLMPPEGVEEGEDGEDGDVGLGVPPAVVFEWAPPQPVPIATRMNNKERTKRVFFSSVTCDPFGELVFAKAIKTFQPHARAATRFLAPSSTSAAVNDQSVWFLFAERAHMAKLRRGRAQKSLKLSSIRSVDMVHSSGTLLSWRKDPVRLCFGLFLSPAPPLTAVNDSATSSRSSRRAEELAIPSNAGSVFQEHLGESAILAASPDNGNHPDFTDPDRPSLIQLQGKYTRRPPRVQSRQHGAIPLCATGRGIRT